MIWRGHIKSGLICLSEVYLLRVSTGMALLGARVGFGAFCVLIVLSLSGVIFGGLMGQVRFVSTALLIHELRSRNLFITDFWQI